jgi:hypothetical protein
LVAIHKSDKVLNYVRSVKLNIAPIDSNKQGGFTGEIIFASFAPEKC